MNNEDMERVEVYITRNGQRHCTSKLSTSGQVLRLLENCFPDDKWSLEKIEKEGKDND